MYTNQLHRLLYAHIVTGAFCLICYFDSFIFLCNAIEHVEWEWCFLICSTRKMLCMYRYSQFNAKYAPKVTHTSDKNNRTEESFRFDIEIYPTHIHFKYQKKKNTFFCFVLSNQPHSTPFIGDVRQTSSGCENKKESIKYLISDWNCFQEINSNETWANLSMDHFMYHF